MRKAPADLQRFAPIPGRSFVVLPDGQIRVDPAKQYITPFTLVTEPEEFDVPAAVEMCPGELAGGVAEQPVIMPIDNKGPFELCYSHFSARFTAGPNAGQPTDQFMVVLLDPKMQALLMNRELHARTFGGGFGSIGAAGGFGTPFSSAGGRPLVWPETFFMDPGEDGKALFLAYRNLTTFPIKVRWAFHGVRYYHLAAYKEAMKEKQKLYGRGRMAWPYFYTTDTDIVMAGGASEEFHMRLTDEADVEIFKMTHFSDFPFLWRIQEKAGKRFLDSAGPGVGGAENGVHSDLGWGDGEFPFFPYETMYYEQNFKLMLKIVNNQTDQLNRIFPTFVCRKINHLG